MSENKVKKSSGNRNKLIGITVVVLAVILGIFMAFASKNQKPTIYGVSEKQKIALAVALPSLGNQVKFVNTPDFTRNSMHGSDVVDAQANQNSGIAKGWGAIWGSASMAGKEVPAYNPKSKKAIISYSLVAKQISKNVYDVKSYASYGPDERTGKKVSEISESVKVEFVNNNILFYADKGQYILMRNKQHENHLIYHVTSSKFTKNTLVKVLASRVKITGSN